MAESDVVTDDMEPIVELAEKDGTRRSKRSLLLLLLLLLLLCSVTTVADTWVNRDPDRARFITRNLDCLQCHTELIPELGRATVHNPFMLEDCTICHTPHGKEVERVTVSGGSRTWTRFRTLVEWLPLKWFFSAYESVAGVSSTEDGGEVLSVETSRLTEVDSYLVAPETELCWICHGDLGPKLGMDYPHSPFEQGYCSNCHNPHASDHRALLVQDERDLCLTCHPMGPQLAREQVHPPAGQRWCVNCHDPHASDWSGILVSNQQELCFRCHPSVGPLSLKAVQHNPFRFDNCSGCHEPHGSDNMPLLIDRTPDLCYDCHPSILNEFDRPSHHPVESDLLDCTGCHNPHAADYSALIVAKDNELCYTCHGYPTVAEYDGSAHWQNRLLCIRCHTPHGSDNAPILRNTNPDLCLECHAWVDSHGNQHPVRPTYFDTNAQKPLTCTTTCHDPHGTRYNFMLQNFLFPQDGQCLQCHNDVGITF